MTFLALAAAVLGGGSTLAAGQSVPPGQVATNPIPVIELSRTAPPPEWALWQRQLLGQLYPAALEFVQRYTRPDGTLIWRQEWPGMDGSDDGYESFYNFSLYHALGGPDEIDRLACRLWEAVTRQFTAYGQVYREFDGYYDWMHHGEGYTSFYFFGLSNPADATQRARAIRFAGLYLGDNPDTPNYDPNLKLIRSPITGSRGPRFVNSAEDWVTHRPVLADYPLPYDDIPNVTSSKAWIDDQQFPFILQALNERMMRGDVPLNLTASSLIAHAFLHTGALQYKTWIADYVGAWTERMRRNGGILPDNVGLSGQVGETLDGKWWGGYYGWRWPHGLFNQLEATLIGAANAYLVTGDPQNLELPRSVLALAQKQARTDGDRVLVPHRHGDRGWYDYRPLQPSYPIYLWYLSQEHADYERIGQLCNTAGWDRLNYRKAKGDWGHEGPWLRFLEGKNPDYPVQILKATYAESLRRLNVIRTDQSNPEERDVHHWQERNPVILEGLVQTMLGSPNHIYHGGLLHCRVRYFDPARQRPGMPPDVGALVERITADSVSLRLVNLHATETRDVILQAGAFGEHQFTTVRWADRQAQVGNRFFQARLRPGAVESLEVGMQRYVNVPSYRFPWTPGAPSQTGN